MADGTISQIQLPNGNIYDIGTQAAIESTYDGSTYTVTLVVSGASDADATEF